MLKGLAEVNFGFKYYPVLHGSSTADVKPFVLIVTKPRPIYKRPFARKEFKLLAELESYVKEDKKERFSNLVNSKQRTLDNLEIYIPEFDEIAQLRR